jgi:hypothetical protein
MTTLDYLEELKAKGVSLWVDGPTLRYRAPKEIITPELCAELKARKAEIIALLKKHGVPVCHYCGSGILTVERENCFEYECEADPLHYSEIKRKPEADRLWADVPLPNEMECQQLILVS